jgi:hypothetical protein
MSDQAVHEKIGTLLCPKCGNDGQDDHNILYLEDIVCHRDVYGVKDGRLEVEGLYQSTEGYDDGTNARFECRKCNHEWPVPDWLHKQIDFV